LVRVNAVIGTLNSLLQELHTPIAGVLESHLVTRRFRFATVLSLSALFAAARTALAFDASALASATEIVGNSGSSFILSDFWMNSVRFWLPQ
jgi:hypothetical protein